MIEGNDTTRPTETEPGPDRRRMSKAAWLGLGGLVLALVGSCVWQGLGWQHERAETQQQETALRVATEQVGDLTTIDQGSIKRNIAAMKARTTGEFERQLGGFATAFSQAVKSSDLSATGRVDSAAIADFKPNSARILVASTATVTNKVDRQPTERSYRISLHLVRIGNRWLIDGMEFVA